MITRYRKRYRKLSRWIHRGSIALAAMLWVALAVVLVLLLVPGAEIRNPAPVIALFAASCVAPFIVAGSVESVLSLRRVQKNLRDPSPARRGFNPRSGTNRRSDI